MALTDSQTAFYNEMNVWLRNPGQNKSGITEKNATLVMRVVKDVMEGRGLASEHLPTPRWLEGFKFDPEKHSPVQLRALGKQWLPPRRPGRGEELLDRVYDSKKGHTIDHAAGYMHKFMVATDRPLLELEPLPPPPPPPTAEQLKAVADRPFSAGGPKREPKRKPVAKKRPREEEAAAAAPAPKKPAPKKQALAVSTLVAGDIASGYYLKDAPKPPPPPPQLKKKQALAELKRPPVPDLDVQEARILFRNASLVKHLRTHPLGDWVKNPHRKVAGKETLAATKERAADAIKGVVREWRLTTRAGQRALAAAEVGEGELSIDRLIARHEKGGMGGLNCIYNLYLMPVRHNAYFGPELTAEKRTYVGERAYQLAKAAHETFVRDTEGEYDWDAGFYKRAETIVNRC
jgi:hypothetical protein